MPKPPKRAKPHPPRGRGGYLRARPSSRVRAQVKEDLAVELHSRLRLALRAFGVTPAQQRRAIERSRRLLKAPAVSGPIASSTHGLGWILDQWSRKPEYVDAQGNPRVLAIAGPGATFESLARRAMPHVPLEEVVALACALAEVAVRPGGKIALLGSILVKVTKSAERHLAHLIRQLDQLLTTSVHNRRKATQGIPGGRMERFAIGLLARDEYPPFMQEMRPQIYDLLTRVDANIEKRGPKTARALKGASVVSVSVYVSEETDLKRAGAQAIASSLRTRSKDFLTP
jgi:hypothetical protein